MSVLTDSDLYAIAQASTGQPWQQLPVSPVVGLLLRNLELKDATHLLRLLGPEVRE